MAVSNRDRVGRTLELLRSGIFPFVERELKAKFGDEWESKCRESVGPVAPLVASSPGAWDIAALLKLIDEQWQYVFRFKLSKSDRTLVFEMRDIRNRWAHQEPFGIDDTNRALDSAKRLLTAVNAPEADEIDRQLQEVLRQKFEEMTKKEAKKAAATGVEGKFTTGLPCWRDVITPHGDVASGNYMLAEFAADLWQVYQDQFDKGHRAPAEYTDPVEFFRRTHLTEGLADLLSLGLKRLCTKQGGADPARDDGRVFRDRAEAVVPADGGEQVLGTRCGLTGVRRHVPAVRERVSRRVQGSGVRAPHPELVSNPPRTLRPAVSGLVNAGPVSEDARRAAANGVGHGHR